MSRTAHTLRPALAAALAVALFSGAPSRALAAHDSQLRTSRPSPTHWAATGRLIDVQVRVERGGAPLYFRPGVRDRHYFEAFKGRNYALVIRNKTGQRVGVLIAVDGINVVNGEQSSLSRGESMYVLDPYERAVIQGWRTSLDQVRRFVFVDEERSYAARTGQANGDLGWIRVLSFREQRPPVIRIRRDNDWRGSSELRGEAAPLAPEARKSADRAQAAPEGAAERHLIEKPESESFGRADESNPGTGWGSRRYDPVQQTVFLAAWRATDRISLRYEYASGLHALGIHPHGSRLWDRENGLLGFARPPRW